MANVVTVAVILVIIGAAVTYIIKAKKSGVKCIGCPAGGSCSHSHSEMSGSGCGCGCGGNKGNGSYMSKSECCCHAGAK